MLLRNPARTLRDLIGSPPLQVGEVASITDNLAVVAMPGGASVQARGAATVGDQVFVRGSTIEGKAPDLTLVTADV